MNRTDPAMRQAVAAALECAARRGTAALETALSRLTMSQRAAVPPGLIATLQAEAATRTGDRVGDIHPAEEAINHEVSTMSHYRYTFRPPTPTEEYGQQMLRLAAEWREKLLAHLRQCTASHTAGELAAATGLPLDFVLSLLTGSGDNLVAVGEVAERDGRYSIAAPAPGSAA